jgi:hypothetical protein
MSVDLFEIDEQTPVQLAAAGFPIRRHPNLSPDHPLDTSTCESLVGWPCELGDRTAEFSIALWFVQADLLEREYSLA